MTEARPTRERIVDEAMRLFGERGYAATTIADIEAAAGLSAGGGGLYRHFRSKRELLDAGVRRQIGTNRALLDRLEQVLARQSPMEDQLHELGHAGIARLEQERDLNRLLVRDLRQFPDLLEVAAEQDIRPVHAALAGWIAGHDPDGKLDAEAVAAVLAGATSHYWLLRDVFGEHPSSVGAERYVAALVGLVAAALRGDGVD
jgi:AcrR family transcriptional regulator